MSVDPAAEREVERQVHDDDDARVDAALHCQTDRVQATRVRLDGLALSAIKHPVHGECIYCVDQRDAAEVDEAGNPGNGCCRI